VRITGALIAGAIIFSGACAAPEEDDTVAVAHLSARPGGRVGGTLSVLDEAGQPVSARAASVAVETRGHDGTWRAASSVSLAEGPPLLDVMDVADNSGSTRDELGAVQDALHHFTDVVLARVHPDRLGLVRVSTEASVIAPPSTEAAPVDAAIDAMFVTNGWTALWDGVRLARDTLADSQIDATPNGLCYPARVPAIVMYTDGAENNSGDEHDTRYAGDGIDTTFEDLTQLAIDGIPVSVHTVAISDDADRAGLAALSDATGGRHVDIANDGQLIGALHGAAAQLDRLTPFCFTPASCEDVEARITVVQGAKTHVRTVTLTPSCPVR
jgi:hypothetical protein